MLLLMATMGSMAQTPETTKPDYSSIEKKIKDKDSPFFFKKLFDRYNAADSTLTLEERRHLYYGYSFTDKYNPYAESDSRKELNALLQKDNLTNAEMQKVISLAGKALEVYPFHIRMLEYRQYFFNKLGNDADAIKESTHIEMILDAILSTGDGATPEKAFYVINVGNEYELLGILGFEFGGEQSLVEGRYDYLKLAKNSYNLKGFYFDVSRSLDLLGN